MNSHNNESLITSTATNPERRTAIKQLAAFCGLALSVNSLSLMADSFLMPMDKSRSKNSLLNPSQLALVREVGELIIPTTDTPGAIAAGVHDFISHQAAYCFSKDEQQMLFAGLEKISTHAKKTYGKDFLLCEPTQQTELLTHMEQATAGFDDHDRQFFKQLKALVVFGYYTSEIGATKELAYLPIPGGYKGSVKFATIGKAWAIN
jgi:hypothetical protein